MNDYVQWVKRAEAAEAEVKRLRMVIALAIGRIERHEPGAALTGLRAAHSDGPGDGTMEP